MSKVKLSRDLPVEPRHGMKKGAVLELLSEEKKLSNSHIPADLIAEPWVMGADGEPVRLHRREFTEV